MAKTGDLKIEEDGSVYKYADGTWVYIGKVPVSGSMPSVGPALPTFDPGTISAADISSDLLSALYPGTPTPEALDKLANVTAPKTVSSKTTASGTTTTPEQQSLYLDRIVEAVNTRSDVEVTPEFVVSIMEHMFPESENALDEFVSTYGFYGSQPYEFEPGGIWEQALNTAASEMYAEGGGGEDSDLPSWVTDLMLGLGGGGAGGVGETAGLELPGGFMDFAKSLLMPGGSGTPSGYYTTLGDVMSPLAGEDSLDFLNRFAQPGQYYPSTMYSLINDALMPMGMNMPEGFYGMMESAMPSNIAPGTPTPDFSFMGGLGQAPMPELGSFLVQLLQGNPELGLALMEASIGMQQQYAEPFLPLLMGPAGQEGGGISGPDFLAMLLGGM